MGEGLSENQRCSGLWEVRKSHVNGDSGAFTSKASLGLGSRIARESRFWAGRRSVQKEPGSSFKLCSAWDWCPLLLEFRAGFLILPTHAQSLPNCIITSYLLYKCCQDSTGQNLKVWWFLKFIPTWTLLKRNPQQGTRPTLGLHASEALRVPSHPGSELEAFG